MHFLLMNYTLSGYWYFCLKEGMELITETENCKLEISFPIRNVQKTVF